MDARLRAAPLTWEGREHRKEGRKEEREREEKMCRRRKRKIKGLHTRGGKQEQ